MRKKENKQANKKTLNIYFYENENENEIYDYLNQVTENSFGASKGTVIKKMIYENMINNRNGSKENMINNRNGSKENIDRNDKEEQKKYDSREIENRKDTIKFANTLISNL